MKRVIFLLAVVLIPGYLCAQNKAIDKLFDKYQGKDGVTTVMVGPELFQVIKSMNIEEIDGHDFPVDKLSSVKILTIEDERSIRDSFRSYLEDFDYRVVEAADGALGVSPR